MGQICVVVIVIEVVDVGVGLFEVGVFVVGQGEIVDYVQVVFFVGCLVIDQINDYFGYELDQLLYFQDV